jgi:hypothetical protein
VACSGTALALSFVQVHGGEELSAKNNKFKVSKHFRILNPQENNLKG